MLLLPEDENLFVYTRELDKEKLLVVCNFTSEEQEFDLPKEFRGAECLIANMSNSYREEKMILKAYEAFVLRKK